MNYEQAMNKLSERINREYEELIATFKIGGVEDCINNAYQIAHINEMYDIMNIVEDWSEDESPFTVKDIEAILKNEDNLFSMVWNSWLGYNHPESFNFFNYEDLIDIIRYALIQK